MTTGKHAPSVAVMASGMNCPRAALPPYPSLPPSLPPSVPPRVRESVDGGGDEGWLARTDGAQACATGHGTEGKTGGGGGAICREGREGERGMSNDYRQACAISRCDGEWDELPAGRDPSVSLPPSLPPSLLPSLISDDS